MIKRGGERGWREKIDQSEGIQKGNNYSQDQLSKGRSRRSS